ncbi:unnamed protein product [Lathyrus sativus]|nr:unnamed protein product [Lathyrus sativus]
MSCVTSVSYRFSINGSPSKLLREKRGLRQGDIISPLLFVITMEYLHRILQTLARNLNFKFHPRCERLNIINLFFADDILLFTWGDGISLQLIMEKVQKKLDATGLCISNTKSKMYIGGVDEETRKHLYHLTGLTEGEMPFRYLEVPLSNKKTNCQELPTLN